MRGFEINLSNMAALQRTGLSIRYHSFGMENVPLKKMMHIARFFPSTLPRGCPTLYKSLELWMMSLFGSLFSP